MKRFLKTLLSLFAALFMMTGLLFPSLAANITDTAQNGSLTIALTDNSEEHIPVSGAVFCLYHVANLSANGTVTLTDEFSSSGVSPDNLFGEGIAEHLFFYASTHGIEGTTLDSDSSSSVIFTQLPVGIYVVAQANDLYDYLPFTPFAVSIPTKTPEGLTEYNVNASPKVSVRRVTNTELSTRITVKKSWSGGTQRPDISVTLMRDGKKFDSVILNESNDWTYTWSNLDIAYSWFAAETDVPGGYTVSYSRQGRTITMTNLSDIPSPSTNPGSEQTTAPPIIDTGLVSWPIPILAGAGIILFAAGYIIFVRKSDS